MSEFAWVAGQVNGGNPINTSYYDSPDMPVTVVQEDVVQTDSTPTEEVPA
jgi:hypothetical protein